MLPPSQEPDRSSFVARWKSVAANLDQISLLELRNLTLRQRQQQIEALLDLGNRFRRERTDFGLVLLRQALHRLHELRSKHPE